MPQVTVGRPFGEIDLSDKLWFQPPALFHLIRAVSAHSVRRFSGRFGEGTLVKVWVKNILCLGNL